MDVPDELDLVVADDEAGGRLDRVLAARDLGLSRAELQRLIDGGRIEVDGRPATRREPARAGSRVLIRPEPPPPSDAQPQDLPLTVLYEDEHLLVVDKAAGMVVHPAPGHPDGTLVNAVLFYFQSKRLQAQTEQASPAGVEGGLLEDASGARPGIVHRLDKDTSGVMVVARTLSAHEALSRAFAAHDMDRRYLAIVCGLFPKERTFDTLHGRHPGDRKRFSSRVPRGRRAVTHVRPMDTMLHGTTLVECRLETGRTHQIRVHLSEQGHAIFADATYGPTLRDPRLKAVAERMGRQALHAAILGFAHPITGEPLHFETAPPPDFAAALEALREG